MTKYIYFIRNRATGHIKIGVSGDIPRRVQSIVAAANIHVELLGYKEGDRAEEQALHKRFAEHRRHGEWFKPSPELLAFIDGTMKPSGLDRFFGPSSPLLRRIATAEVLVIRLRVEGKDTTAAEASVRELREQLQRLYDEEK
jgi:hypothetical protein